MKELVSNFFSGRGKAISLFLLLSGLMMLSPLPGQELRDKFEGRHGEPRPNIEGTRGYSRFSKDILQSQGHARYLRFAQHDGNLVTGGVINSGLLSFSQVSNSPRISWPKGSLSASYIYGAYFYVAAEVTDANGDTIAIVSDNYRVNEERSPDGTHYYGTMPLPGYFNLDSPNATETPLVYGVSEDVGADGLYGTNDFGEGDGILQSGEDINGNGILDTRLQNVVNWLAITHRKETWPEYWPVGSYAGDPRQPGDRFGGPRAQKWNGEFGAYIRADQESYYVMDDRENDEFDYYPFGDPRPWPDGRRGLGITTEARVYQWNARLAEDIMIAIYDITNEGQDLDKVVVGMYVDPDMGGSFTNDDANFNDRDDITYTWNKLFLSSNGLPLGYFGFAFLESPGLSQDGIDNDGDGLVDESQQNGIDDDGDWIAGEDLNGNGVWDTEDVNYNGMLDPGEDIDGNGLLDIEPVNDDVGFDGLGPQFFGYPGPDEGEFNFRPDPFEPNFEFTDNDESDQVGLTSWYLRDTGSRMANDQEFWDLELRAGIFNVQEGYQRDIAFTYGSGFVSFAGTERTHRYAIALLFGNDLDDILRNKRTMQQIYDNDYNFTKPPLQPNLTVTADDGKVFLAWDNLAERSRDPIYGFDFEAYYIYKSTEPAFKEIKTITDAFGNPLLFKPLAIFDLDNGLFGAHPVRLGSELGGGSDLGITYNMGTDSGLQHHFVDEEVTNGRTYYYAVASIDQGYHPSFYPNISELDNLLAVSPTECPVNIQTDPLGRAIAFDRNTAQVIPTERSGGWVPPTLSEAGIEHVSGDATGSVAIEIYSALEVKSGNRYRVEFGDDGVHEPLDPSYLTGLTNQITLTNLTEGTVLYIRNDPVNADRSEELIAEGFRVVMFNDENWVDSTRTGWSAGDCNMNLVDINRTQGGGTGVARDYEVRIRAENADTSVIRRPANFSVYDVTDPGNEIKMPFLHRDFGARGILDNGDRIIIYNVPSGSNRVDLWTWEFLFPADLDSADWRLPEEGDVMSIYTTKEFDRSDVLEFTLVGNEYTQRRALTDLDSIYVVPDPYIGVSSLERKVLNPEEGRGDRRIDFVNLPRQCTVTIFTVSGKMVRKLNYSASDDNRRLSWDMRTKDGLEIAHGVYFYAVEVPGVGTKTGKFAIIK